MDKESPSSASKRKIDAIYELREAAEKKGRQEKFWPITQARIIVMNSWTACWTWKQKRVKRSALAMSVGTSMSPTRLINQRRLNRRLSSAAIHQYALTKPNATTVIKELKAVNQRMH